VSDELLDRLARVTETVRELAQARGGNEGATRSAETARDALPPEKDESV
jgi:hypothetical protein